MGYWGQLMMHDSITKVMSDLIFYHDRTLLVISFVLILVGYLMTIFVFKGFVMKNFTCGYIKSNEWLEMLWTFFPMFWLVLLGGPSLSILYSMEMSDSSYSVTMKAIGHQWYWSYEYTYKGLLSGLEGVKGVEPVEQNVMFDSYMMNLEDVMEGKGLYRMLEVDNRIVCPSGESVRILVGADDVMHCWTIPSLGLKVDAIPGRLNSVAFKTPTVGVFYGQCSEICGANHSFMPITLEIVPKSVFNSWWFSVSGWAENWLELVTNSIKD